VDHLGYVQIDTIHVIERCHHHILYSRIPAYAARTCARRRASTRACSNTGRMRCPMFPRRISASSSGDARAPARGPRWFASVKPEDTRKVMRLMRRDGALTIRDIEDDVLTEKEHLWQSRKPSKRALQLAFYTGEVTSPNAPACSRPMS
jgi:uncharacterized protein YcaQ